MACVKKVVPWVIDPIGTALQKFTGFDYTPGGMANKLLNPPKMTVPQPKYQPPPGPPKITMPGGGGGGSFTMPAAPPPPPPPEPWRPAPAPEPSEKLQREGSGATASTDRTRGLVIGSRKKGGDSRSLLG